MQYDEESPLNYKQQMAVDALTRGMTQQQAADHAEVSRRTVQRWLERPDFMAEMAAQADEIMGASMRRLNAACLLAVDTWIRIMQKDRASDAVKSNAANYVMTHMMKWTEMRTLQAQLDRIEERLNLDRETIP